MSRFLPPRAGEVWRMKRGKLSVRILANPRGGLVKVLALTTNTGRPQPPDERRTLALGTLTDKYERVCLACAHAVSKHYDLGCIEEIANGGFCKCVATWRDETLSEARA